MGKLCIPSCLLGGTADKETPEEKLRQATEALDSDGHYPVGRGVCFDYGINYGCDDGCPIWAEGKCREVGHLNDKNIHLDKVEFDRIKASYIDRNSK